MLFSYAYYKEHGYWPIESERFDPILIGGQIPDEATSTTTEPVARDCAPGNGDPFFDSPSDVPAQWDGGPLNFRVRQSNGDICYYDNTWCGGKHQCTVQLYCTDGENLFYHTYE